MKASKVKNKGIKMTAQDVRILIDEKKERLANQQRRMERMEQTMQNTTNDIEQLEYTLQQLKRAEKKAPRVVCNQELRAFFAYVIRVYERLQHRLHRTLNYVWFCLVLRARYSIQSHIHVPGKDRLSATTILNYFKQERDLY